MQVKNDSFFEQSQKKKKLNMISIFIIHIENKEKLHDQLIFFAR